MATASIKWKVFVQAKEDTATTEVGNEEADRKRSKVCPLLSGEGAQKFYEDLLGSSSNQSRECIPSEGRGDKAQSLNRVDRQDTEDQSNRNQSTTVSANGTCSQLSSQRTTTVCSSVINKAFRCAQENNVDVLKDLLDSGLNVNTKDAHGWSLLMVASCAGAKEAVKILLNAGARVGVRDSKGNTALILATRKGHNMIIEMLISANKGRHSTIDNDSSRNLTEGTERREFFCDVCNTVVKETTEKQHKTSIAHQFCLGTVHQQRGYGIPPSNKGYQLLINHGWDEDRGLGPESQGIKFPIKTVLKRDRMGLGSDQKSTARVTHFGPADTSAVKRVEKAKTLSKRERRRQITKEKRKDIDLRRELYGPDYS